MMGRGCITMFALAVVVAVTACSGADDTGADFRAVSTDGWAYGDPLSFTPDMPDSVATGSLAVAIRHTSAYIFSNLWLEITVPPAPDDSLQRVDTVNVTVADDFGSWLGRGAGVSYMKVDTLPGSYTLTRGCPISVRHIMRVDTVCDLEQVGIIFIRSGIVN